MIITFFELLVIVEIYFQNLCRLKYKINLIRYAIYIVQFFHNQCFRIRPYWWYNNIQVYAYLDRKYFYLLLLNLTLIQKFDKYNKLLIDITILIKIRTHTNNWDQKLQRRVHELDTIFKIINISKIIIIQSKCKSNVFLESQKLQKYFENYIIFCQGRTYIMKCLEIEQLFIAIELFCQGFFQDFIFLVSNIYSSFIFIFIQNFQEFG
eukprot:TRINITY_DN117_c0_g1_i1.p2 TRINITY_DN117_c0_g1~~TRINITY_DN117_c0_g1_i1.p2  ORF type:complete len:208 (-),score=-12.22 TRINITY_DN117_c0_g1_i1:916-1539(-)